MDDIPDEQPTPRWIALYELAATRQWQMPDRLLHQGAQPGLATVVGAFGGGA
jgi:hypothetical protein